MANRAELLRVLQQRLDQFAATQDAAPLLEQAVLDQANELAQSLHDGAATDLEAMQLLGELHWYRYLNLPYGQDQMDLQAFVRICNSLCLAGVLPDSLVPFLDGPMAPYLTALRQWVLDPADKNLPTMTPQLWRYIADATPADHPDRVLALCGLGVALLIRNERMGEVGDLDEAVEVVRQALRAAPADHPYRLVTMVNLSTTLLRRFERMGSLSDLDDAIETGRQAVRTTSADQLELAAALGQLATALQARFKRTGDVGDLDEAVEVGRQTVRAMPADHPHRATALSDLGSALRHRFERLGAVGDLHEAVDVGRQATRVVHPHQDHFGRSRHQNNLGIAVRTRFERLGAVGDLDEAVEVGREAVRAMPADHPEHV
ncbi:tetratricopeptide repeat protein, partial [Sphaerisporangium sp. B11E5]|uniref:tetratricopeptide repeat protein n=1 Tax=Sphaerisporangium sp. B11E5 TaxID=3153563 RepID=UPI00325E1909